jgi:hypothetical protein
MKRKILIVSSTFYPINTPRSFRATELVKEFARQGHEVTVYTVKNDEFHIPFEKEFGVTIKSLGRPWFGSFDISRGGKIVRVAKRAVNRALSLLLEYPDIELMLKVKSVLEKETNEFDLLISIAVPYPVHWGVAWARSKKQPIAKLWVADCGDPYMGDRTDSFRKLFYFKYVEKWFSKKADFIAITNIHMKPNYYPEFHDKIVEIPQGFNFEETTAGLPEYKPNSQPTFAYAGNFIQGARDPSALIQFLVKSPYDFKFLIFSPQKYLILPYLEAAKGRIELRDFVPRTALLKILRTMDFLINISYDVRVQSPSKLIDYYLVGRPVLSLHSNEVNEVALHEFFEGNYANQFQFVEYEKFRIQNVCSRFLSLLDNTNN